MYRVVIEREDDVYMASTLGKRVAEEFGLNKSQQTKLVVSIMELTRNIVFYAKKGELFINPIPSYGIEITALIKVLALQTLKMYLKIQSVQKQDSVWDYQE